MTTYDAIVIGAGIVGSGAAYHLSKAGQRVLLLEQFERDHKNGSSYGDSRIIRYAYDKTAYIKLIQAVFPLWEQLSQESGETLFIQTGGIDFGYPETDTFHDTLTSLREMNIPHELLSPDEAQRRFPQFRFADAMKVIYQADSGILAASACVRAHLSLAEKQGAVIKENSPVTQVQIQGDSISVHTAQDQFSAGRLIIAAGGWANDLLAQQEITFPLEVLRCQLNFYQPEQPEQYTPATMPVFIAHNPEQLAYGMPTHNQAQPAVKAAWHGGPPHKHPSEINYEPDDHTVESVRGLLRSHIPGVADAPLQSARVCLYTMTPDKDFIMDVHPEHPQIVFGAGFSGHGFKFGTLLGKILTDLALSGETEHDISLFRADRFRQESTT